MLRWNLPLVALAFVLAAPSPPAHAEDEDAEQRGRAALVAPETSPQPGATGEVEIRSQPDRQRFAVEVENVDPLVDLAVFLDDGTGTLGEVGSQPAGSDERELVFDTGDGDSLPFGATTVADLVGRALEVRDGTGAVVLQGTLPALGVNDEDGDGDDDGDDDEGLHARGRSALMRDAGSPFPEASGHVEVEAEDGEEEMEIEAEHLDSGTAVEFFLEDDAGVMVSIGLATADDEGEAEIEFETEDGNALPLNAWTVADLAGRRVEVRTADGTLILFGIVPEASPRAEKLRASAQASGNVAGSKGKVASLIDPRAGRERLRIDAKKIGAGSGQAELYVDDGSGALVLVGTAPLKKSGRTRFQYDTKKGQALPLTAETLTDLSGRAFEIRVDGLVVLSGTLPQL